MPYIAFDLDALKKVPDVADSSGLSAAVVGYGLTRLWAYCFSAKTDRVSIPHLSGFFGGEGDRAAVALAAFGFLEASEPGSYRVRGAERYLRIAQARSKGGKAASANLKRGQKRAQKRGQPEAQPETSRDGAGEQPESSRDSAPAAPRPLHRAPSTEYLETKEEDPPAKPAGPSRADWDALVAVFASETGAKYQVQRDSDPPAFKALFPHGMPEVLKRWRRGLLNAKSDVWPGVTSVAQLRARWNDLAVERGKDARARNPDLQVGTHQRSAFCVSCAAPATHDAWGVSACETHYLELLERSGLTQGVANVSNG